jgi:tyrosine-protein kinase Etk/Wzc
MKNHSKRTRKQNTEKASTFDFASIVDIILVNRWLLLCTVALFICCGGLYAVVAKPVYQTRILVQVEDTGDSASAAPNEFMGDVSSIIGSRSTADGEIQILGSKLVIAGAVDALQLYVSAQPHYFPYVGRWIAQHRESLPDLGLQRISGFAWGNDSISVSRFEVPQRMEGAEYKLTTLGDGMYEISGKGLVPLRGRIGVTEQFETQEGPIRLQVKAISAPQGVAFDLVRNSRQLTIDTLQGRLQIAEQGTKSDILAATLTGDDPVLLSKTLNEIGDQYIKQNADRRSVRAEASLAFLSAQLPAMKNEVEQAENRYNTYRYSHASIDMGEQGRLLLQQSSQAQTSLYQLKQRQQELAVHYSADHPQLQTTLRQIESTQRYLDSLTERIKEMPSAEQGALRLMREVRVSSDLYASLRANMEHLQLLRAGKIGSVRVVDNAEVPEVPVKPRRQIVLAIAAVLGLFAGVGLSFARDMISKGVTDPNELDAIGLNVYGSVLLSEQQEKLKFKTALNGNEPRLLASLYPKDPAIESMRVLRTALQVSLLSARNNVVMLTGPMPSIGKSFLSANLAAVLASGGKRVLLVDADLRKGHLHSYLGLPRRKGLTEMMSGSLSLTDAIQRNVVPNLDFIATGAYPENAAELLLKGNMRELIASVSSQYDIVLIDTAAVLAVSDAGIVAPVAGSILITARYGVTRVSEMSEAVYRLKQAGCKVHGILLNGIPQGAGGYAYARKYGVRAYGEYYESKQL